VKKKAKQAGPRAVKARPSRAARGVPAAAEAPDATVLSPREIELTQRAHRQAALGERRRRMEEYDAAARAWSGGGGAREADVSDGLSFGITRRSRKLPLRILAEGDSWFDFPFGGRPFRGGDVIERLRDLIPFPILSLAVRGDEARTMLGVAQRRRLRELLEDRERDFNVLLFSGGGNDIVGEPFRLWIRDRDVAGGDPARALNDAAFGCILQVVRTAYEDLLDLRDKIAAQGRSITVLLHAYDWGVPSGVGVCGYGPWLHPSLEDRGWTDAAECRAVVREALTRFADLLEDIARQYNDVVVVRTQGTLGVTEWNDELHPNRAGFPKIARKFHEALKARFPAECP
jgi:hypothetical protein